MFPCSRVFLFVKNATAVKANIHELTTVHITHKVFLTCFRVSLLFLFRISILDRKATVVAQNIVLVMLYKGFGTQSAERTHFRNT